VELSLSPIELLLRCHTPPPGLLNDKIYSLDNLHDARLVTECSRTSSTLESPNKQELEPCLRPALSKSYVHASLITSSPHLPTAPT
jgi:hypothetical protein